MTIVTSSVSRSVSWGKVAFAVTFPSGSGKRSARRSAATAAAHFPVICRRVKSCHRRCRVPPRDRGTRHREKDGHFRSRYRVTGTGRFGKGKIIKDRSRATGVICKVPFAPRA